MSDEIFLTKAQARRFILYKQGLLGEHRFRGKEGVLDFIRQAGCVQFDPIDVCGKSPEITLQSRVAGFTRAMLYELLYEDRRLVDYFDKNLAILPVEDWKYFGRERANHRGWERSHQEISKVHDRIIAEIAERGPLSSGDLDIAGKVDWYWSETKLSRAALEHMYFCGELAVHHKRGNMKYYDLIRNCIPAQIVDAPEPCPEDMAYLEWRVLRRISAVGLLWNRPSDAWLGIPSQYNSFKAKERNEVFARLLDKERILPVKVEGLTHTLYCLAEDAEIAGIIREDTVKKQRCEFIAPLDNMMWDRNLIREIFDFDYKWEIYTPQSQRKYGYYVLPILFGERLVGRIEMVYDRKNRQLDVLHIWYEPGMRVTKKLEGGVQSALKRYQAFCGS